MCACACVCALGHYASVRHGQSKSHTSRGRRGCTPRTGHSELRSGGGVDGLVLIQRRLQGASRPPPAPPSTRETVRAGVVGVAALYHNTVNPSNAMSLSSDTQLSAVARAQHCHTIGGSRVWIDSMMYTGCDNCARNDKHGRGREHGNSTKTKRASPAFSTASRTIKDCFTSRYTVAQPARVLHAPQLTA